MNKKVLCTTIVFILAVTASAWGQVKVNFKIGYVDIQKALNTCESGKAAAAGLNKELEMAKQKYESQGKAIMQEKEALDKQGPLMEEEVARNKVRELEAKYRDWERYRQDVENDIKRRHNEIVDKVSKELIEITDQIGKEGGYTIIVERSLVPYIDPSLDVTDEVTKRHNEKYSKGKSSAPSPKK
jgi:outer membrane protein